MKNLMKDLKKEIEKMSIVMSVVNFALANIAFIYELLEFTFRSGNFAKSAEVTQKLICSIINRASKSDKKSAVDEFLSYNDKFISEMRADDTLSSYIYDKDNKLVLRIVNLIEKCNQDAELKEAFLNIVVKSNSLVTLVANLPKLSEAYLKSGFIEETAEIATGVIMSVQSKKEQLENLEGYKPAMYESYID